MGSGHTAAEINAAVREGVTLCRQSAASIVALAQYIDQLHATGWSDADVLKIGTAIRRIFTRMLDDSPWPMDED